MSRAAQGRIALGALGAVGVLMTAGGDSGPGICVVRHLTGGYCPGCGGTRAATHLVSGELTAAWQDHPWVVLAVGQAAVLAIVAGVVLLRSAASPRPGHFATSTPSGGSAIAAVPWPMIAALNVTALLAIWVIRLSLGQIPAPF